VLWANRAMAALKLGLLEKAEEDCTQALALAPTYDKVSFMLACVYHTHVLSFLSTYICEFVIHLVT